MQEVKGSSPKLSFFPTILVFYPGLVDGGRPDLRQLQVHPKVVAWAPAAGGVPNAKATGASLSGAGDGTRSGIFPDNNHTHTYC